MSFLKLKKKILIWPSEEENTENMGVKDVNKPWEGKRERYPKNTDAPWTTQVWIAMGPLICGFLNAIPGHYNDYQIN